MKRPKQSRLHGGARWLVGAAFAAFALAACSRGHELAFSAVPVKLSGFRSEVPTTTSVVRVGTRMEETALIPQGKLSEVESLVGRLRKEGWRQVAIDIRVNEVYYVLEKEDVRLEFTHRPSTGITIVASRSATSSREK